MSLTYTKRYSIVPLASEVSVRDWPSNAVASLAAPVSVSADGLVSFTVSEPGTYEVRVNIGHLGITDRISLSTETYDITDPRSFANSRSGSGGDAGAVIDDDTVSQATTYSSSRIEAFVRSVVDDVLDGAPGALDTLKELATALGNDANFAATVTTALNNRVPTTRTVAGKALSANITLVKADVGLGNVDNTSDVNKPVSTATQTALNGKAASTHAHAVGDITGLAAEIQRIVNESGLESRIEALENGGVLVLDEGAAIPAGTPANTLIVRTAG